MKKKILFLLVALFAATTSQADPEDPEDPSITLTPIFNPDHSNGDNPRSPMLVPVLYIDGYTLTASDNTLGSTIRLLDENDNVVFSTYVAIEGDINLPTTLSGTYTIQVVFDNVTFVGEIEL